MPHPLLLGLFSNAPTAAAGARALHALGVARDEISVVSRTHQQESALAEQMDASPGADIEDSRPAARLGELGGLVIAAIALVLPGIGPIVAAGPMSADLGEAAGHAAGSVSSVLARAGVPQARAETLQREVEQGSVLLGVHVRTRAGNDVAVIRQSLLDAGAVDVDLANWEADG